MREKGLNQSLCVCLPLHTGLTLYNHITQESTRASGDLLVGTVHVLKGTVPQYFRLLDFFMNQFP
jgi:hypothetical protein